jgi:hypothetical protein
MSFYLGVEDVDALAPLLATSLSRQSDAEFP